MHGVCELAWGRRSVGGAQGRREGDGVDERNDLISSLTHSISFRSNHHLLTPFLCLLGQASALCRLAHLVCAYFSTLHRVVVSVSCRPGSVKNHTPHRDDTLFRGACIFAYSYMLGARRLQEEDATGSVHNNQDGYCRADAEAQCCSSCPC